MEETLTLAHKISTISFPVMMVIIVLGSYFEVWVWGRQLRECKTECAARLAEKQIELLEWKQMTKKSTTIATTAVDQMAQRE